ncbi:DUF2207 domain-containing protein [Bacillus suaedae]|uniref:DUF2207 domain-containing protein n=1 Tax=Halalkalibacter suaedae TaxID=2822140 RepID=A0A940WY74_9BACI|nr:DUF2207 domain-containing protein [Bacillus suaedae]MBP3950154.1 DUF2207 domain-containing protein [Bacillus suaedae]
MKPYLIEDGVTAYADVAEFYWPFFDDRNDSSYEQLTITVHPPEPTSGKIYYCNDGHPDDNFDDLVFKIEIIR